MAWSQYALYQGLLSGKNVYTRNPFFTTILFYNITIARKSGNILYHTESNFFIRHSSEYETSDNDRKLNWNIYQMRIGSHDKRNSSANPTRESIRILFITILWTIIFLKRLICAHSGLPVWRWWSTDNRMWCTSSNLLYLDTFKTGDLLGRCNRCHTMSQATLSHWIVTPWVDFRLWKQKVS